MNEATTSSTATVDQISAGRLTHLQRLEAEAIQIMREAVSESDNPAMLYSIGKDSSVMVHLAMKAFYPSKPPFPLVHVDTTWKFSDMYQFRDDTAARLGLDLVVYKNPECVERGINPFDHGSAVHTDMWKTEGLKQVIDKYKFDLAFGGARRDEEKSRAKERIFSVRSPQHQWDPKRQRPELWQIYNARRSPGETLRVFPISNWTELDVWQYVHLEQIPEVPDIKSVRFRTLGCYPLSGAIESEADTLTEVIQEMLLATTSERQGRIIDFDGAASMEKKKQEGYF
ncbi:MAG: sulfate adenylyltransferase subunit 2 [Actinobacteria bacterium]|nr:sulfate adenylyltransferase subunit 2 [Actinomycetota bacterium]